MFVIKSNEPRVFFFVEFFSFTMSNMSDKDQTTEQLLGGNIKIHSLEKEIKKSYIEYSMSVIVSRALPDTRDGFKPVLRRILYAMYDMKMFYNSKHKKSARIVWEVLGKYHPHGDSSVYEAMVRMAQHWNFRYPLVDWQGNFWSMDWDSAAAMRYTEARLTKIAEEMAADIEQDTVDWKDNFDGSLQEPVMLPTKFPNHLCNGTMGIAVWMATNMAPHNLNEVIDACLLLLEKEGKVIEWFGLDEDGNEITPDSLAKSEEGITNSEDESSVEGEIIEWEILEKIEEEIIKRVDENGKYIVSIDEIMEIIKGPDFPTGWYIFDSNAIKEVYKKWKWGIVMRGRAEVEDSPSGQKLVIREIPFMVNKSTLVSKIWELVVNKRIDGVTDIRDETSKDVIRIVIDIKKWFDPDKILVQLFKYTDLQCNFNMNNVSLIDAGKQPRLLNIKDLLMEFVVFRRQVVYRRSVYQLNKAKDRLHILEGLKKAIDIIDEVIETIKKSSTKSEARENLMSKFDFSETQAEYILMLRLQSLVGLEIQKIAEEIDAKLALIAYLEGIIWDEEKLDGVVREEMEYIKSKFGDKRRTRLSQDTSVYNLSGSLKAFKDAADKIKEDVIVRLGDDYSLKVLYQTRIQNIPEETLDLVYTHNQDKLIIITDRGELVVQRLKDFGSFSTSWKALDLKSHFELKWKIIFAKTLHFHYEYLVFMTNQNSIKKIKKELLLSFKKFPTVVMKLANKENIVSVKAVKEWDHVGVLTQQWWMLMFNQEDLRAMWKTAWWVKAIDFLDRKDQVVNMFLYQDEPFVLIYSDKKWKLLNVEDLKFWKRARKWQVVATGLEKLIGWISIVEWSIRIRHSDGELITLHSNDVSLDETETPLGNMVKKNIEIVYRPREEKDENMKYKEEKKQAEKEAKSLFEDEGDKEKKS